MIDPDWLALMLTPLDEEGPVAEAEAEAEAELDGLAEPETDAETLKEVPPTDLVTEELESPELREALLDEPDETLLAEAMTEEDCPARREVAIAKRTGLSARLLFKLIALKYEQV